MVGMHGIRGLLSATALIAGLHCGGAGASVLGETEPSEFLAVWLPDRQGVQGLNTPALLNVPPGWCIGDAAAVILPDRAWPTALRERLVAALLASGAAVLELNEPPVSEPRESALRRDLREALRTLSRIEGAGLMVAISFGEVGEAMLVDAELADGEGRSFAALVSLGPHAPRFRIGDAPEAEGWSARAPLFCALLAEVQPGAMGDFASACQASIAMLR